MTKARTKEKKIFTNLKNAISQLKLWPLHKKWLVLIIIAWIILAIWIWLGIDIPTVIVNGEERAQTLYLLSAVAQSLAAVFALVFTISLVVAQLSSRYSHRMLASLFDIPTILYILLFILSVLLPFWLLAEPRATLVKVSLFLAAACLLGLIPYFLSFREKLNPESLILDLQKKSVKQLQVNPSKEPEEVATIDNFIMSAFALKDYDTFKHGVSSLTNLALEAADCKKRNKGKSELEVCRSILTNVSSAKELNSHRNIGVNF